MRPTVASVDIETYGALKKCPEQTVFAPQKYASVDGIPYDQAIKTASITFPKKDPRKSVDEPWTLDLIRQLEAGDTMLFDLTKKAQRARFLRWMKKLDTIILVNGGFDIGNLRYLYNAYDVLHDQFLIDGIVLNFQYSELRQEKSLKAFGVLSGLFTYASTAKNRFNSMAACLKYNGEDTHNTMLMVTTLAADIRDRLPLPARDIKLTPFMLKHYSDLMWECILKTEAGIPHNIPQLVELTRKSRARVVAIEEELDTVHGLKIAGKDSVAAKVDFIDETIADLVNLGHDPVNHELFTLTEKGAISTGVINRNLFRILLPDDHARQRPFELWQEHGTAHKLYSTYCHTRLWCRSNKHADKSSALVPISKDCRLPVMPPKGSLVSEIIRMPPRPAGTSVIGLCHPTWFIVPSSAKEGEGSEGGTIQGRAICKSPAAQTDPPAIQATKMSRWRGGCIVHYDLSQIELRIAAILSGDPSLMNAYLNDEDLHTGLAVSCEGIQVLDNPHFGHGDRQLDPRQWYKQANFLIAYRGSWMTLLINILKNCNKIQTEAFARGTIDSLKQARSGLWIWQDKMIHEAKKKGRLDLPIIGMSRYFMGGTKFEENEICNFPVQTWAGTIQNRVEVLNGLALDTRRIRRPTVLPIINIYDAIEYDCKTPEDLAQIDAIMEQTIQTLETTGIYGQLCDLTGNRVPLQYSREILGVNNNKG